MIKIRKMFHKSKKLAEVIPLAFLIYEEALLTA